MNKTNIIDIILPNNRTFSLPATASVEIVGSSLLHYLYKFNLKDFVICRRVPGNFYDVLYVDNQDPQIVPLIKLSQPFSQVKLADILIPNRFFSSPHQRIPVYVFHIKEFLEMLQLKSLNLNPRQLVNANIVNEQIKVQLITGLVISINIDISKTIEEISKIVYDEMCNIYKKKRVKDIKEYRFGTTEGYYPSIKTNNKFKDEPILMEAYRNSQLDKIFPKFLYLTTYSTNQPFDKTSELFKQQLDLSNVGQSEEIRSLNSSLSVVRKEVETKRIARLEKNPLLARMRLSENEPQLKGIDMNNNLNIKCELKSAKIDGKTTALSIRVPYKETANEAIQMFFDRLSKFSKNESEESQFLEESQSSNAKVEGVEIDDTAKADVDVLEKVDDSEKVDYTESINSVDSEKSERVSVSFNKVLPIPRMKPSDNVELKNQKNQGSQETLEYIKSFNLVSNTSEVPFPLVEDDSSELVPQPEPNQKEVSQPVESEADEDSRNPNDYAFVINGTDEVIAGDIPLLHFVCVQQFILKQNIPIMFLLLYKKQEIVNLVRQKELKANNANPEIPEEKLTVPIVIKKPPRTSFDIMSCYPHSKVQEKLSIFVRSVLDVPQVISKKKKDVNGSSVYALSISLINGTETLGKAKSTRFVVGTTSILFNEMITLDLSISCIPRTARITFTLYNVSLNKKKKKKPLGTYNFPVYSFSGWMNSGRFKKKMWTGKDKDVFLTTCESNENDPIQIAFRIPSYKYPIIFMDEQTARLKKNVSVPPFANKQNIKLERGHLTRSNSMMLNQPPSPRPANLAVKRTNSPTNLSQNSVLHMLSKLAKLDPLTNLTSEDKLLLKHNRDGCSQFPELLSLYLTTIDYKNPKEVQEIPNILDSWKPLPPEMALSLLDAKYADQSIRNYAVERFELFTDNDLMLYLLQLVQALKYELYDDSLLARFLIKRGLNEPKYLGHQLFWQLMSEAHISHIRNRFSILLLNFMYGIGSYTDEFIKGYKFTQDLVNLNTKIRKSNLSYGDQMQEVFRNELKKIEIPNEFHLPIDPKIIVDSFIIDKCKVMNSKKKPFLLLFKNASPFDTDPPGMLFKVGDDLRQDQLTLQVMKVMEHLWRTNYKDMHMRCYGVLPTGFNQGFIEAVPNSVTEAELQAKKGTIAGVLEKRLFTDYFQLNNPKAAYEKVLENFRLSSAAYAVATCVLGVADRHPGNIMVQKDGHYFHIDFGHFLGNFKVKMGYKRESAPFHFSPACAYTLSEKDESNFALFESDAANALNILRHNANLLITLLMLMVGTGIPELSKPEDIQYMKDKLFLNLNDDEAAAEFKKLTKQSIESTKTKLNNFFHNLKVNSV